MEVQTWVQKLLGSTNPIANRFISELEAVHNNQGDLVLRSRAMVVVVVVVVLKLFLRLLTYGESEVEVSRRVPVERVFVASSVKCLHWRALA